MFAREAASRIAQIYQLKRELVEFKRAVLPLQARCGAGRRPLVELPPELRRYFRDVDDHLRRTSSTGSPRTTSCSTRSCRPASPRSTVDQNNDMRKIASWAAIAALQTAIAGIYGMNFDRIPGLHWQYGFYLILVIMAAGSVVLYRSFRRSGWL